MQPDARTVLTGLANVSSYTKLLPLIVRLIKQPPTADVEPSTRQAAYEALSHFQHSDLPEGLRCAYSYTNSTRRH